MKLGVVTDEISQDLERALDVARELGFEYVELRTLWDKNVVRLTDSEAEEVRRAIRRHGLKVAAIAGPFFKSDPPGKGASERQNKSAGDTFLAPEEGYEGQLGALERCIQLAHVFETRLVRSFSFWRLTDAIGASETENQRLEDIVAYFETPLTMAANGNVILALENEHACRVASGAETASFYHLVRERFPTISASLGLIWDPGNAFFVGERPYPDGYRFVRSLPIVHVHVKDARVNSRTGKPEWAAIGQGEIDFRGFFAELSASGYSGVISLETHFRREGGTPESATRESFGGLMALLKG